MVIRPILRTKKKMTQSKLGELLGVQDAAVSKYESGKLPLTDDTLKKLAKIFDVTTDYILNLEPPNQRITNEEWNKKLPELTKKDELDIKKDLEKMLEIKVNLKLWVKVREDWINKDSFLKSFRLPK